MFTAFVVSCAREFMRRSTFYDEDLSEVVDLSEHGTWANANLCEIIQDLVDALFPLQTMSEGHEERFVLSTCKRVSPFKRTASRLARDTGISHTSVSKTVSRRGGTRTREAVPSPWSNHLGCEGQSEPIPART